MTEKEIDNAIDEIILAQTSLNTHILDIIVNDIVNISKRDRNNVFQYFYNENEIKMLVEKRIRSIETLTTNLLYNLAYDVYKDAKSLYEYRNREYKKFIKNNYVAQVVFEEINKSNSTLEFVNNSGIIMLGKNSSSLNPLRIDKARKQITDTARHSIILGTDFHKAMRKTIGQLANSGIRVATTEEGKLKYTQRTEVAFEKSLQYSARDVDTFTNERIGKQVQADGIELSAHIMPAPDHAPAQGHQFTMYEFENMQSGMIFSDIQGRAYSGFDRKIGTWNCRHTVKNIVIGVSKQRYSDEHLQKILEDNQKGIIVGGRHRTLYECTQIQRRYENQIRNNKLHYRMYSAIGDNLYANKYKAKIQQYTSEYFEFSKRCGISPKVNRLRIE